MPYLECFLKNMKNVKLTKMKIFKNLLMHSTWVKVLVFFLKDFSLSVCQIIPYLQLSWIIHTLVLSVSLLHISVCSNPPALSLVLSSRVVVRGGGEEGAEAAGVFYGCSSRDNLFSGTPLLALFLWHHKFLHFLWPALGGYKGHTWPLIVCLALSSVSLLLLPLTSSTARLSDCLKILRSLRSGRRTNKSSGLFDEWQAKKGFPCVRHPFTAPLLVT